MEAVTGVVLAGGKSSRMGVDKAGIQLASGGTLLAWVVELVRAAVGEVLVVTDGRVYPDVTARWAHDLYRGAGPLGGIHAGLLACESNWCLVVACDMPFLSVPLLRYMVSVPRDYDVLLPRVGSGVEPLHAVYSRTCLAPIVALLESGKRSVLDLFDRVRTRTVTASEISRLDPGSRSFVNINSLDQLAVWSGVSLRRSAVTVDAEDLHADG